MFLMIRRNGYLSYVLFFKFCIVLSYGEKNDYLTFPDDFLIGSATSSYQVEGAWNISDKGENILDRFTHTTNRIIDKSNGDVACDSYHKYKEDVQLLKKLGVNLYRFSLSWTRILPTGYANVVSKDGLKYYNDLLDELEKNDIQPFVTIYHWDHPQVLQELGSWTNEAMVDIFGDYARVVFREFGHRIKLFVTINEPRVVCSIMTEFGHIPQELLAGRRAEYLCNHNILKAHARAYHIYNNEFRSQQNGKIGIPLDTFFFYSKNKDDNVSNEVAFQFSFGRFANPIYSKYGDYPSIVKKRVAENSRFERLTHSRLPTFSAEWINYIRNSFDFLGLNHYSSQLVEAVPPSKDTIYNNDEGIAYSFDEKWPKTSIPWIRVVPQGMLDLLRKIKQDYENPPVYITENGFPDNTGTVDDIRRIEYLHSYINATLVAIQQYGCNVKGYFIWSLLDNFEWIQGYNQKFGVVQVDFKNANRTRTPKRSFSWLSNVLRARKLLAVPTTRM